MSGQAAAARGLVIGAPRSGAGKTSVTLGLLGALTRRGLAVRGIKIRPRLYRPRLPRRRHAAGSGSDLSFNPRLSLGHAAGPAQQCAGEVAARERPRRRRERHGPLRRHRRRARPHRLGGRHRRGCSACRSCWCSTCPASRRPPRRSPRASPPTTRTSRWPASSSTGSAASAIAAWRARPSRPSASPWSAPSSAMPASTLPERHLGLVQASEHADLAAHLARLGDMAERSLDLDAIVALAKPLHLKPLQLKPRHWRRPPRPPARRRRRCHRHCLPLASASRSPSMPPSPSSIRTCSTAGAGPGPRSCRSRRSPTPPPAPIATPAGCPAAIPNCMPAASPRPHDFAAGLRAFAADAGRCMASAAASWCWGAPWWTATVRGT